MKWVIFGVKEEGQTGVTTRENYDANESLRVTVEGTPCTVYDEFEADDYETAKARYEDHMGWGR